MMRLKQNLTLGVAWMLAVVVTASEPATETPAKWVWEKTMIPQALVINGLWGEYFQIDQSLDKAGFRRKSEWKDLSKCTVAVIVNTPAVRFPKGALEKLREFVNQGGGLVVLGGLNADANGEYEGTPLADMLPVSLKESYIGHFPTAEKGAPLSRDAQGDWPLNVDFQAGPIAWYFHNLVPKNDARVQVKVGDRPAIVCGVFGSGRVVACALTVNGNPAPGELPFWNWKDWPGVLGQALEWSGGARPAGSVVSNGTPGLKPLTEEELLRLESGLGELPKNMVARALINPDERTAKLLFEMALPENEEPKCGLSMVLPVLIPFARAAWIPKLNVAADAMNPGIENRKAALILLGACRDQASYSNLARALKDPRTATAAMDGLGLMGNSEAIPLLQKRFNDALATARLPEGTDRLKPDEFAAIASPAAHAAVALYKLGDPEGVARVCTLAGNLNLYLRIMRNASKRWPKDPQGKKILDDIIDSRQKFQEAWDFVLNQCGPIPSSQGDAFIRYAMTAENPVIVTWLAAAMETSAGRLPKADWPSLSGARSGILSRMTKACVNNKD